WIGSDQVTPPSVEREKAMLSYWPPLKRASFQTAYRLPFLGSTAVEWPMEITPIPTPLSGSVTPAHQTWSCGLFGSLRGIMARTFVGPDQVWPLSVDRITERAELNCGTFLTVPVRTSSVKR